MHTRMHTYIKLRRQKEFEANMVKHEVQVVATDVYRNVFFLVTVTSLPQVDLTLRMRMNVSRYISRSFIEYSIPSSLL